MVVRWEYGRRLLLLVWVWRERDGMMLLLLLTIRLGWCSRRQVSGARASRVSYFLRGESEKTVAITREFDKASAGSVASPHTSRRREKFCESVRLLFSNFASQAGKERVCCRCVCTHTYTPFAFVGGNTLHKQAFRRLVGQTNRPADGTPKTVIAPSVGFSGLHGTVRDVQQRRGS